MVVWLGYLVYFGVTNFGNAFLVHHLVDRDEIYHDYGYWCVACLLHFGELWPRGSPHKPICTSHLGKEEKLGQRPIQISPGKKLRCEAQRGSWNCRGSVGQSELRAVASCKRPYGGICILQAADALVGLMLSCC